MDPEGRTFRERSLRRSRREGTLIKNLGIWLGEAEPILAEIVSQHPEEIDGLRYYSHVDVGGMGVGSIHKTITFSQDQFYVTDDYAYSELQPPQPQKRTSLEIAQNMLGHSP
ncbi:MAG TPA: hypothetical protein ENH99_00620 [Candidatus Pacearchaeota archaeon]|nr:hypothetical protein [Candidatus Pacearchaeota archaeon]